MYTQSECTIKEAFELMHLKQYQKALDTLAIKPQKSNSLYVYVYVRCHFELKNYSEIISYRENIKSVHNQLLSYVARSYQAMKQFQEAVDVYQQVGVQSLNKEELINLTTCYEELWQCSNKMKAHSHFYQEKEAEMMMLLQQHSVKDFENAMQVFLKIPFEEWTKGMKCTVAMCCSILSQFETSDITLEQYPEKSYPLESIDDNRTNFNSI